MTVRANRAYLLLAAIANIGLAIAFLLSGLLCWPLAVVSVVFAALYLAGGIQCARSLRSNRPALEINADGVVDNTDCLPAGLIRWDQIRGVRQGHFLGVPALYLDLNDANGYIRGFRPFMRFVLRTNVATCGTPIGFHQWCVRTPLSEIQARIESELRSRQQTAATSPAVATERKHWWTAVAPEERTVQVVSHR